jgi:hypothetical protein
MPRATARRHDRALRPLDTIVWVLVVALLSTALAAATARTQGPLHRHAGTGSVAMPAWILRTVEALAHGHAHTAAGRAPEHHHDSWERHDHRASSMPGVSVPLPDGWDACAFALAALLALAAIDGRPWQPATLSHARRPAAGWALTDRGESPATPPPRRS